MTLAEIIAQMQRTPRGAVRPETEPMLHQWSGRFFKEPDIAADSLGTLDLSRRIQGMQNMPGVNANPNIQTAQFPPSLLGQTIHNPVHMGDPDIQLNSQLLGDPTRWSVLNHELGHYLSNYNVPMPEFPKPNDVVKGSYSQTSPDERMAEGFSHNVNKNYLRQAMDKYLSQP